MGRHGYEDDWGHDNGKIYLYRGAVHRAIQGRRGQAFLRRLLAALEAMPEKKLASGVVPQADVTVHDVYALQHSGGCCTLGAYAREYNIDTAQIVADDPDSVAEAFGIARSMAAEIEYVTDELAPSDPEKRWAYMHEWVVLHLDQGEKG